VNKLFSDLSLFEEWFRTKLMEEKRRRVNFIQSIWDSLSLKNRNLLIDYLNNKVLSDYKTLFIEKNYSEFYLILRDQFELSYELFINWLKLKKEKS
jgi:hypothetical protein